MRLNWLPILTTVLLGACLDSGTALPGQASTPERCTPHDGFTTVACLETDPSAEHVTEIASGGQSMTTPAGACDFPELYDLGGGVFTVEDIVVVDEASPQGVMHRAYCFLKIEQGLTSEFDADLVVRQDPSWASWDAGLRLGDRIIAVFRSHSLLSEEERASLPPDNVYINRGFYRIERGAELVDADDWLTSNKTLFGRHGLTFDETAAELRRVYGEVAAGKDCNSEIAFR